MPRSAVSRVGWAAVALLAGCNDFKVSGGNDPPPEPAPLTITEAALLVSEVRDEIGFISRGYSVDGQLTPRVQVPVEAAARLTGSVSYSRPRSCAQLTPVHWPDQDFDRVPDNLTVAYDSAHCTFTGSRSQAVFTLKGQVRLTDPSTSNPAIGLEFRNLEQRFRLASGTTWIRRVNGQARLTAQSGGFTGSDSAVVFRQSTGRGSSTLEKVWALSFVSGDTYSPRTTLPTGVLSISGSLVRTVGSDTRQLLMVTASPLVLDAACTTGDHVTSGTLELDFDSPSGGTAVRITWSGCGNEPSVTVNPPGAGV
jgi:hypothetical protein